MKRILFLSIILMYMCAFSVQALSWQYPFVVWKGKVYEVKQEEIIDGQEVGKKIGKVETKPIKETGEFYGNASNSYPKGTDYYEIKGVSSAKAIAIKEDDKWLSAVYRHKAPFHIMNILIHPLFTISVVGIIVLVVVIRIRIKNQQS
ncbi:hypothetical protein [Bacillus sp. 1P06AnD]|uniref:hypothetical protein n=1 Tax=Bacillus sp. 1P06AnD TaxID=3132208 RepID=UPI0039A38021